MDLLSQAVEALHVRGVGYYRSELGAPWGLRSPGTAASFHVVTRGRCLVTLTPSAGDGVPAARPAPVWLAPGDVAVLPHATPHTLQSDANAPVRDVRAFFDTPAPEPLPSVVRWRADAEDVTDLVCGLVRYDAAGHPLLDALPPLIVVRRDAQGGLPWLEPTLQFLTCEATHARPGADATIAHLASIVIIHAIRAHLAETEEAGAKGAGAKGTPSWLRAVRDPAVHRALQAAYADPAGDWTVGRLAERAHLSRSAFAARFTELMGTPPMEHLTDWRMREAARRLRATDAPLAEVAAAVGYASPAAFARAFKRAHGAAPGRWRTAQAAAA